MATLLSVGCGGEPETAVDQSALMANLGRAIGIAQRYPGQFAAYAAHDRDEIERGKLPPPADTSALTQELVDLLADTPDYSEAILLLRVAGQDLSRGEPPVPAELSSNPRDPNWEFAGHGVFLPWAVQQDLARHRTTRDATLDAMSDSAFSQYESQQAPIHRQRRQLAAQALGWRFDARDDLYVVQLEDGDIWRKKKPLGYVPPDINEQPGSQQIPPGTVPDELVTRTVDFRGKIIGNDQRDLRSRANGFSMGGAAWEPKGAIADDSATEDELPVQLTCTGTKISARQVLTSGHCMFLDGSWNDNTKWIPGADGVDAILDEDSTPAPNGIKNRDERIVRGPWFDHEWANYDFGVFILFDNSSSCSLHWHGWRKRSGLNNDPAFLYGYPNPSFECDDDSPLAGDACGGSIWGHGSNIGGYVGAYRFDHYMDTQEGQSGSGVYEITGGDRFVLGVHRGPRGSINNAVRINDGNRDLINESKGDFPADACD